VVVVAIPMSSPAPGTWPASSASCLDNFHSSSPASLSLLLCLQSRFFLSLLKWKTAKLLPFWRSGVHYPCCIRQTPDVSGADTWPPPIIMSSQNIVIVP